MKYNQLSPEEEYVIVDKGTETPFSGEYDNFYEPGIYVCRRCMTPLYNSADKFDAHCGWPSFDQEIAGRVKRVPDADGKRTEISCIVCSAHLGHVFVGEKMTAKDTRHCVNSLSLKFIPTSEPGSPIETIVLGNGCFWCSEAIFKSLQGVRSVMPGYAGGEKQDPTYEEVSSGTTGHAEVVRLEYNPGQIDLWTILKVFFTLHDPTSVDRQGSDVGPQYRSIILYSTQRQHDVAISFMAGLEADHVYQQPIVTQVVPLADFYAAEDYHRDYFTNHSHAPYCQMVISPKIKKLQEEFKPLLKFPA
ncbi:MAG: bifunctional methionine sulfoxide reductase B/A protein [Candidatus Falkowbacteria bacterium]